MSTKSQLPPERLRSSTSEPVSGEDLSRILRAIRPSYRSRGGDIELVGIKDRSVTIRLSGACGGCPIDFGADAGAIERIVRSRLPQIHQLTVV
jgi:Fe-S cluster biogenesis protein NfuA